MTIFAGVQNLAAGIFDWPKHGSGAAEVNAKQLQFLLEGGYHALGALPEPPVTH